MKQVRDAGRGSRSRWFFVVAAIVAVASVGCGSDDDADTSTPTVVASRLTAAQQKVLGQMQSGDLRNPVFVAAGEGAVAYGGLAGNGTVNRTGMYLDRDGTGRGFQTDVGLNDATGVVVDGHLFLAGLACTSAVTIGDDATSCTPGTLTVLDVDLATSKVTEVGLGDDITANTSPTRRIEIFPFGGNGDLAITSSVDSDDGLRFVMHRLGRDGTVTALPAAPGFVECATSSGLYAFIDQPIEPPAPHEMSSEDPPAATNGPLNLARLTPGSDSWVPVTPAEPVTAGDPVCTESKLVIHPSDGSKIMLVDEDGAVTSSVQPGEAIGHLVGSPSSDGLILVSAETFETVDVSSAETAGEVAAEGPVTTGPVAVLSDGVPATVTADGLEVLQ